MSLFVGSLAFDDEAMAVQVRVVVLAASVLSGVIGTTILSLLNRSSDAASAPAAE